MPHRPPFLALALAATVLAAGAKADETPLTICPATPIAHLDPARALGEGAVPLGAAQLFDTLVAVGADGTIVPRLARWWDIAKDGLEIRFKLRAGVQFHATGAFTPSREMNAEDVAFTFARQIDPEHPLAPAQPMAAEMVGLASILQAIEARPDGEVSFRLKAPHSGFLALLAMGFAGIQSAEYGAFAVREEAPDLLDTDPVGTGPFRFAGRDAGRVLLAAHAGHWEGAPAAEEIAIEPMPDAARRYAAVRGGTCHIALDPEAADLETLAADPVVAVEPLPQRSVVYLAFNTARPPLDDRWVRRALAEALDRTALAAAAPKGAQPAAGLTWPAGDGASEVPEADPDLAATHLEAAGTETPITLTLLAPRAAGASPEEPEAVAAAIAETWRDLGLEVRLRQVPWDGYLAALEAGEHEAAMVAFAADVPDEAVTLETLLSCAAVGTSNLSHWCHRPFDNLLKAARSVVDPVQRGQALKAAAKMVEERAPAFALFRPAATVAVRREVEGADPAALARGDLRALSLARDAEPQSD